MGKSEKKKKKVLRSALPHTNAALTAEKKKKKVMRGSDHRKETK